MAGSLNKVCLIGMLGRDPETKSFQNGGKVVNLRIATSESWKDRTSGERKEKTEWHSVAVFAPHGGNGDGLAGIAERYLRKGSQVYIEGKLQTRKWQDQQGADRYTTEIVLQGYGAVLTMIGKAPEGGGSGGSRGGDDWGGEDSRGRSGSSGGGGGNFNGGGQRSGGFGGGGGGGGGFADDLDDDVPF